VDILTGATLPRTPERGVRAHVQEVSHRLPCEMLFGHNARDKRFSDLYRVVVVTRPSRRLFENMEFAWLFTDVTFQLRLASRYLADGSREWLESAGRAAPGRCVSAFRSATPTGVEPASAKSRSSRSGRPPRYVKL
jgi:hypothetical protein